MGEGLGSFPLTFLGAKVSLLSVFPPFMQGGPGGICLVRQPAQSPSPLW